ncbi:bacterial transcriptional activator domain-containing protein [Aeromicrobium sp. CF3.5]|uniref:bacterial transcriptional activator domain-containing protein n=1 Tax=Aeromicrobium sp. CF3.5 TaxID=3373078 RepID=UPI003EE50D77
MSSEDERQFARAVIARVLESHARSEITAGRTPPDQSEEAELAYGIHAALYGVGLDDEGSDVMLDLEAAGGIVSIGGDSTAAGEVAAALAIQCATSPWSGDVQVTAADLPEGLDEVGDDRIRLVTGLGGELDRFEQEIGALRADVLTGRMSRHGRVTSHVLVAGSEPDDAVAQRLASLVGAGRQALAEEVVCDWDVVCTLLQRSRRASTPRDETDALSRALGLVRGEAFTAVPEGRYGWVARDDMPRTMSRVLVDAAKRLCDLNDDDPGRAASAAQAGLLICPGSQPLWRELIRASYAENGPAGIHRTLDQMSTALQGIALEAETEALVEELLPDTSSMPSSG